MPNGSGNGLPGSDTAPGATGRQHPRTFLLSLVRTAEKPHHGKTGKDESEKYRNSRQAVRRQENRRNGTLDIRIPAPVRVALLPARRRQLLLHLERRPGRPARRTQLERGGQRRQPCGQAGSNHRLGTRRQVVRCLRHRHSRCTAHSLAAHHARPAALPEPFGTDDAHRHDTRLALARLSFRHTLGHLRHGTRRTSGYRRGRLAPFGDRDGRARTAARSLLDTHRGLYQPQHHQGRQPRRFVGSQRGYRPHGENSRPSLQGKGRHTAAGRRGAAA